MTSPNPGTTLTGKDGKVFHVLPDDAESAGDSDLRGDFAGTYGVTYTLSAPGDDASVIIEDGAPEGSGVRVNIAVKEEKAAPAQTASTAQTVTIPPTVTTTASTDAHTPDAPAPQAEFMPERSA